MRAGRPRYPSILNICYRQVFFGRFLGDLVYCMDSGHDAFDDSELHHMTMAFVAVVGFEDTETEKPKDPAHRMNCRVCALCGVT